MDILERKEKENEVKAHLKKECEIPTKYKKRNIQVSSYAA